MAMLTSHSPEARSPASTTSVNESSSPDPLNALGAALALLAPPPESPAAGMSPIAADRSPLAADDNVSSLAANGPAVVEERASPAPSTPAKTDVRSSPALDSTETADERDSPAPASRATAEKRALHIPNGLRATHGLSLNRSAGLALAKRAMKLARNLEAHFDPECKPSVLIEEGIALLDAD